MLKNKVIVVAGGAGLIGKAFTRSIVDNSGIVIIADINIAEAKRLAHNLNLDRGGMAHAIKLDINNKGSISDVIAQVSQNFGKIDAIVNNSYPRNKNYGRNLESVEYEDFCENMAIHLGGFFLVAQQFCLYFKKQGYGNVVNIGSIYGTMTPRFKLYENTNMTMPVEYSAIKAGVIQLTRYFAQYFKSDSIRINCLSPGGVRDKQQQFFLEAYGAFCGKKGMLEPKDLTGALVFLLSDASIYMTGQNLQVDDGFSL